MRRKTKQLRDHHRSWNSLSTRAPTHPASKRGRLEWTKRDPQSSMTNTSTRRLCSEGANIGMVPFAKNATNARREAQTHQAESNVEAVRGSRRREQQTRERRRRLSSGLPGGKQTVVRLGTSSGRELGLEDRCSAVFLEQERWLHDRAPPHKNGVFIYCWMTTDKEENSPNFDEIKETNYFCNFVITCWVLKTKRKKERWMRLVCHFRARIITILFQKLIYDQKLIFYFYSMEEFLYQNIRLIMT